MAIGDRETRRATAWACLLIVLLVVRDGLCYTGELMDGLPVEYQKRLQLLQHALAYENRWSPIWSEKLKPDAPGLQQPDPEFCTNLIPDVAERRSVDTFAVIKEIVNTCWFSGMYVGYGLNLLSRSVRCFHHRHARLQLAAIDHMMPDANEETVERYLRNVVTDYQLATDKLAAVESSLKHSVQLVTFYNDVANKLSEIAADVNGDGLRGNVKKAAKKIRKIVESDFKKYCAVPVTDKWYDDKTGNFVDMAEIRAEDVKPARSPEDPASSTAEDAVPPASEGRSSVLAVLTGAPSRIEYLRQIMRRTFDGLLIELMPQKIWSDIFFNQILMKAIDLQKVSLNGKTKNTPAVKTGKPFPWRR